MIIRKPMPRAIGIHEPMRHPDHPKPRTRREFLSQGFIAGSAFAVVPSMLGSLLASHSANALDADINALKAVCNISNGAGMVPFISFDLSGGANIAGSNVLVGKQGGQMDFLATAGYGKLGLPGNLVPSASATGSNVDTSLGLAFHADSAFLRGIKTRTSQTTRDNINGVVIPAISQNDTANNVWCPLYHIAKTTAKGSLVTLAGTSASPSGGNSIAMMSMIDPSVAPVKVSSPADVVGLGPPSSDQPLFTSPSAQNDMVSVVQSIERVSRLKLDKIDTKLGGGDLGPDGKAREQVQCAYVKPANTASIFNGPSSLDPRLDPFITGAPTSIFQGNEITQGDFAKTAAIMKLIVNGYGGAATIQMGGFDYHSGNRADGEKRDFNAGVCMGACLEYAARVGQPLMLQVFSDGSLNSTMMIDNSVDGRGKLGWQGDNQTTACTFFLVYNPPGAGGRPTLLGADKQQLGCFKDSGDTVSSSSPGANAVNLAVEMIVLNYLALHGRQGEMPTLFPGTAFGSTTLIDQYSSFAKIR
jgi:hypothetical protein